MPGLSSPNHPLGADGPPFTDPHPSQPIPSPPPPHAAPPAAQPAQAAPPAAAYPGLLPPPVPYPKRRHRRLVLAAVVAAVVIAGLIAAILHDDRGGSTTSGAFSDATAKTAIQGYLDALKHRDTETIARNSLCGIYDAVRDRRTDEALAKLSSEAFRKQFSEARVTSIDKIVYLSNYQVQVLFSMHIQAATGGAVRDQVQGMAQLLDQHNQLLVCSYVLRTAGSY
jgi:hypothetical protein